ncbi:MAG: hypothetical protein RLZZ568_196 [Cyanobacteriota bacterium]
MKTKLLIKIVETRFLVGFLGEKKQEAWWDSTFLSSSSKAFLAPIYPNSYTFAQYSGVCRAASNVHDNYIGIGRHYHLYRLSDSIEQMIEKYIKSADLSTIVYQFLSSREIAMDRLEELGTESIEIVEGPFSIGNYSNQKLESLLNVSRSHYINAIRSGYKTFPYMRC